MSGDHNQYQKNLSYLDFECPRCGHCCYVDADDTSQDNVDEIVKCRHEWVGLTDEDMEALFLNEDGVRFARYIEAKLREKNT